ncbi:MAG TPA: hypothetical protein EYG68_11665 [Leucothrix mucor]|nr:hypothetical protein [Leucothrix mucor]
MLQTINDKAKGWLAYTVVFLISVPFALFGINSYLGGGDTLIAATVNGEEIPVREVQNELLQQKQRLSSMLGGKLPVGFDDKMLKAQALEGLINQALMRQQADDNGYRASDAEVFALLSSTQAFHKDGVFDQQTYEKLLESNRRNKVSYESSLRKDISTRQLLNGISDTSFIPDAQAAAYQSLLTQVRDFDIYTLKLDDYKAQIKPTDDEIKAYYDSNSSQYMTEERIKISYVRLKSEDLFDAVTVTPETLQTYYDENAVRYSDPEQRKISHILIKADDEDEAKKRAEALHADISSGKTTFDDAASNNSDDKFAAEKSGDMGFFARGDRGALFDKVAFSLEKGQLSEPTKTSLGYEIIKVSEIKAEVQKTFEEAKADVEKDYRSEQVETLFRDQYDKLQTVAFENDSSIDPAAQSVGLEVQTSDWFTRAGGKGLAAEPSIVAEAFSNSVLNEGKNSILIEISDTDVAVIRVESKEEAKQKPMADVSDQIKQSLIDTNARKLVNTKGESILAKLKSTGDWSSLSEIGASADAVEAFVAVDRKASKPLADVVRKVFAMNVPKGDKAVFSNTILATGDYILIGLKTVKDGKSDVDEQMRNLFVGAIATRERSAVIKALREEADVVIFTEKSEN